MTDELDKIFKKLKQHKFDDVEKASDLLKGAARRSLIESMGWDYKDYVKELNIVMHRRINEDKERRKQEHDTYIQSLKDQGIPCLDDVVNRLKETK